jgi:hypothetical protein
VNYCIGKSRRGAVEHNEAREIADSDKRGRMRDLEAGKTPAYPDATWCGRSN